MVIKGGLQVNGLLLALSMCSIVLQNGLFNSVSKGKLKTKSDRFRYNSWLYLICFALFGLCSIGTVWSLYSAALGLLFGVVTMLSNYFKLTALSRGPMHITVLITTSSMIIPAMSGALFFNEAFSVGKGLAILALIFFIYVSLKKERGKQADGSWVLCCVLAFVFQGGIGVLQKVHQSSAHRDELLAFLTVSFLFSCVFSGALAKPGGRGFTFTRREYLFAALCGLCTFCMNLINLRLSGVMPSQLFFPLVNGGSIILTSIMSVVIFREHITKRQTVGLAGGLLSLILICVL